MTRTLARLSSVVAVTLSCLATVAGCGSNGSSQQDAASPAAGLTVEAVPRETALAWPERFCRLRVGMTRREVRAAMSSPPTQEFLTGGLSQDQWHAYQFNITIFFEDRAQITDPLDQRATQLDPDSTGQLTPEDKALFPCGAETVFR